MTLKRYQTIRLVTVVILASVFSQSIVLRSYLVPVAVLVVASLLLMYLRRQVDEVVADERDYATGGKAALMAIQIYAWIAVAVMFVLYALRDINPSYEPIGMTLAFSTCLLMMLYGIIFRYYNKFSLSDKKYIYIAVVVVLFVILGIATLRVFSGEDNWLCQNGQWVKHGQPDFPAPTVECK